MVDNTFSNALLLEFLSTLSHLHNNISTRYPFCEWRELCIHIKHIGIGCHTIIEQVVNLAFFPPCLRRCLLSASKKGHLLNCKLHCRSIVPQHWATHPCLRCNTTYQRICRGGQPLKSIQISIQFRHVQSLRRNVLLSCLQRNWKAGLKLNTKVSGLRHHKLFYP